MTTSSWNKLLRGKNHENVEKFKEGHHGNHGDVGCLSLTKSKNIENTVGRSKRNTTFWVVSVENFPGATERLPDKVVLVLERLQFVR